MYPQSPSLTVWATRIVFSLNSYLKCHIQNCKGNSTVSLPANLRSVSKFQDLLSLEARNGLNAMVHSARLCDHARLLLWLEKEPTAIVARALAWDTSTDEAKLTQRIGTLAGTMRYLLGLTAAEKVPDEMLQDRQSMWTWVNKERRQREQKAAKLKSSEKAFHRLHWFIDYTD